MFRSKAPILPACSACARRSALAAQALLRQALLGDVGHDADEPVGPAIGLPCHHEPAAGQPQRGPVRPHDAVLGSERVLFIGQPMQFEHQVPVVWVQRRAVLVMLAAHLPSPRGQVQAEQRHALARPGARARHQVGLPRAHAPGGQRRAVARLAFAQRLRGAVAVGGIDAGDHRLQRPALVRRPARSRCIRCGVAAGRAGRHRNTSCPGSGPAARCRARRATARAGLNRSDSTRGARRPPVPPRCPRTVRSRVQPRNRQPGSSRCWAKSISTKVNLRITPVRLRSAAADAPVGTV